MEIRRRLHDYANVVNGLTIVGRQRLFAGNAERRACTSASSRQAGRLPGANSGGFWALGMDWFSGMVANLERDGAAAVPFFGSTLRRVEPMRETSFQILALTDLCTAHLLAGDTEEALEASRRAVELLTARERSSIGAGFTPASRVVVAPPGARGARREARKRGARCKCYALLLEGIETLSDEGLRRSYLNKIDSHRAIVRAWIEHAAARHLPVKRHAAHLAGKADLRAPFERLVDTGMRMNELRSAADLHEFLVDEVTELSGAERVLLVLERPTVRKLPGRCCRGRRCKRDAIGRSRRCSTQRGARARRAWGTNRRPPTRSTSARSSSRR
jgi:hypothetical protein